MISFSRNLSIVENWDYFGSGCSKCGMGRTIPSFRIPLAMEEKKNGSHSVMLWTSQTERSLMKCGSFLGGIFQLVLVIVLQHLLAKLVAAEDTQSKDSLIRMTYQSRRTGTT